MNRQVAVMESPQTIQSKVSFWQAFVIAAISIVVSIGAVGASYAKFQSRLDAVETKQLQQDKQIDDNNANVQQRLEKIQDRMVDKDLFNETRQDVKKLLERK
jgi:uncharacterized protein HemX